MRPFTKLPMTLVAVVVVDVVIKMHYCFKNREKYYIAAERLVIPTEQFVINRRWTGISVFDCWSWCKWCVVMATQASLSLVLEYDVTVITDATETVCHVGKWRPLARAVATHHLCRNNFLLLVVFRNVWNVLNVPGKGSLSTFVFSKRFFFVFRFSELFISSTNKSLLLYYFMCTRREQHTEMYETVAKLVYFTCLKRDMNRRIVNINRTEKNNAPCRTLQ